MLRSIVVVALLASSASAQQPKPCPENARIGDTCKIAPPKAVPTQKAHPRPTYDMEKIDVKAKNRRIMLIEFLERTNAELERASLEKRSFMPELVRTLDAEQL
jgi:hypothetical protein